jgi:hypothetical protein
MAIEAQQAIPAGLSGLAAAASGIRARGLPPVHDWNPPHCGDIGLKIARDGKWFYRDSEIARPALVRLFSTILRKDPEGHVLVTPVEKVTVEVEDAPFLAVELRIEGADEARALHFRTNVDDWVCAGPEHPLRFTEGPSGGTKPYLRVRDDLWALVARPVFYELADFAEQREIYGKACFGVLSSGRFFAMDPVPLTEAGA